MPTPEDNVETTNKSVRNKYEDKNENVSVHTPSRDVSVDGETQINSKILSLIETEMKRDINKHSHFTDSRPQSLSFYEDEKVPKSYPGKLWSYQRRSKEYRDKRTNFASKDIWKALSGFTLPRFNYSLFKASRNVAHQCNLELLSPEERKHYKKRKEYVQMDTDERNAYNVMQDLYNSRDAEDIMTGAGPGRQQEMMIPKEKRKSKKKKRDSSPAASNNSKRKHKKRDEDLELRNDITVALEELQDDVFENSHEDFNNKTERMKKSPRRSDKLYVQKKNKFEVTAKPTSHLNRQGAQDFEDGKFSKRDFLKDGLRRILAGKTLTRHIKAFPSPERLVAIPYPILSTLFHPIDIAHIKLKNLKEVWKQRKSSIVVVIYVTCLIVHLSSANYDDKMSLMSYSNNTLLTNITRKDLATWNHLSLWRAILAFTAWIFVGLGPPDDTLYYHLKNMEAYLPDK
ncbi:hypothetical protein NQ318_017940 [Aromia moschata]|uniref:Uncharacterized protein n=1 Tax=Aromia moschata TaxID=1265417 RepID=A0AAV8Y330_9CUCU|nr:hypothetical protein NQ318_017940 [Aromia moschata]